MRIPLFLLVLGSGLTALAAGANLWPDSDFELSGLVGEARSGTKACHLSVDERVYWRHAGLRKIEVEPFATYELTAWVKGKAEDRPGTALYAYSYNCYGWFNGTGAPVTVQEAAESLGMTLAHARQRLKIVLGKTNTHRQSELVMLVSRLATGRL